jgi:hypothetical protein
VDAIDLRLQGAPPSRWPHLTKVRIECVLASSGPHGFLFFLFWVLVFFSMVCDSDHHMHHMCFDYASHVASPYLC